MEAKVVRFGKIFLSPLCVPVCRGIAIFCGFRVVAFWAFWHVYGLSYAAFHVFDSHHPLLCDCLHYSNVDAIFMNDYLLRFSLNIWQQGFCLDACVLGDTLLVAALAAALVELLRPGTFLVRSTPKNIALQVAPQEGIWPPPPTQ